MYRRGRKFWSKITLHFAVMFCTWLTPLHLWCFLLNWPFFPIDPGFDFETATFNGSPLQSKVIWIISIFSLFVFVCVFQSWTGPEKLLALDELIDSCEPTQVKHMMQVIEPQFQRDFISLLPKEVSSPHAPRPLCLGSLCILTWTPTRSFYICSRMNAPEKDTRQSSQPWMSVAVFPRIILGHP